MLSDILRHAFYHSMTLKKTNVHFKNMKNKRIMHVADFAKTNNRFLIGVFQSLPWHTNIKEKKREEEN